MLKEAISGLQDHDENHMNHHEQAETQRGVIGNSQQIFEFRHGLVLSLRIDC